MKNKLVAAILIVALFIPTIIAIVNYVSLQGGEVSAINVESIKFVDPTGAEYIFARDGSEEEVEMLDFFISLRGNAEKISEPPSTINDDMTCNLTAYTTAGNENSYKYYFSSNKEDCFFVDGNGDTYRIDEDDALAFLNGSYAGFIFENGTAPTLNLTGSGDLVPDTSAWNFIGADAKFIAAAPVTKDEIETVELEGGFNMSFTTEPDLFTVKVTNKKDGVVLFDDSYENMPGLTIDSKLTVSVDIVAKWYEDETRNYYGEQNYKFEATLSAPAEFYAGTNTIQIGEFICVTAVNVNAPENITFTCEPNIAFTPKFYAEGDYAYALIPFNNSLAAGEYNLTFNYGSTSQNIVINLTARDNAFGNRVSTYADAIVNQLFTDEIKQKAADVFTPLSESGSAKRYFEGSFLEVCPDGILASGYGHTIAINGGDQTFVHEGVDYAAAAGTEVVAANAGEVVYAGYTDYSGYTVVIEHGYGLKGWYSHLEEASVAVGDIVAKGDKIGECGATGFAAQNGVHIGYTVFGTPVCQYTLWSDGINKGIPVYNPED